MSLLSFLRKMADKITGSEPKTTVKPAPKGQQKGKSSRPAPANGNAPQKKQRDPNNPNQSRNTRRSRNPNQNSQPNSYTRRPYEGKPRREQDPRKRQSQKSEFKPRPKRDVQPTAPVIPQSDWKLEDFVVAPAEDKKRFHDFNLPPEVMHAVHEAGFQYCTPIQAETLSQSMAGANVAGKAQTGTGKTAAFLIAILHRMMNNPETRPTMPGKPLALVIAPTRELVMQIIKDAEMLGKHCGLRSLAVYGGMDHAVQQDRIESEPLDLIAATPGRLLDFTRSRILSLKEVKTLVIDEADRMLDMGFIPDVKRIIYALPDREQRQTLLFSATLTDDVMRLASQWMPNPIQVEVDPEHGTVDTINQIVYPIAASEKFTILYNTIKAHEGKRMIIFRNRKRDCDDLCRQLAGHDIHVEQLSGDVDQKKRIRILEDFRSGKIKIVVATDVAGRGIHVDDIAFVVNYDFPYEADDYIHRIGRTGRAGTTGTAISFACEDESFIIPDIEKLLGEDLHCQQPEEHLFAEPPEPVRIIPRKRPQSSNSGSKPGYRSGPYRGGRSNSGSRYSKPRR